MARRPPVRRPAANSGQIGGLAGRVLDVKFLGAVALLEVGIEGFDHPLRVRAREIEGWRKGVEVRVEIDPDRVLVFASSGAETM